MIIGIGVDLIEHHRVGKVFSRFKEKFLHRVFNLEEQKYCLSKNDPVPFLSARFAVKEAFIKALNFESNCPISYNEICVIGEAGKKKHVELKGMAKKYFIQSTANKIHLSMSHSKNYSVANIILEKT